MTAQTRAALHEPSSSKWHDGSIVIDLAQAVHQFAGDEGVEAMNYAALKRSLGPVVAPFLKVSLALFGARPDTILKRFNESLGTVMTGVTTQWQPASSTAGRLVITHPDDVREVSWPCWKGSLRFIYDLCGVQGTISPMKELSSTRTLVFDCAWS